MPIQPVWFRKDLVFYAHSTSMVQEGLGVLCPVNQYGSGRTWCFMPIQPVWLRKDWVWCHKRQCRERRTTVQACPVLQKLLIQIFAHEGFVKACPVGWIPTTCLCLLWHTSVSSDMPVSNDMPVSPTTHLCLLQHTCVSYNTPVSPMTHLCLHWHACVSCDMPVSPMTCLCLLWHACVFYDVGIRPTGQALTKPSWVKFWPESLYGTWTCLDCCSIFSA